MKLVMTLLVRDEEDILQQNIEFHLAQGVDFIIATDNKSVDSTASILNEYKNKGVLHSIFENNDNYNQHVWVTRMARMASIQHSADWVINNDADEFWWPVKGSLKETFQNIPPEYNIVIADRYNFVAIEDISALFYHNMVYKEKVSLNPLGAPLPPKVAHRANDRIAVKQGNHSVAGCGPQNAVSGIIEIFHFPNRNKQQLLNKIIKGGAAYERNEDLSEAIGRTWRELYREYKEKGNLNRYLKKQFYDKNRIRKELHTGELIKDVRLRDFLDHLT